MRMGTFLQVFRDFSDVVLAVKLKAPVLIRLSKMHVSEYVLLVCDH